MREIVLVVFVAVLAIVISHCLRIPDHPEVAVPGDGGMVWSEARY